MSDSSRGPVTWWRGGRGPLPVILVCGALWRLFLEWRYAGWEESDYGNLAMIRGVLDGHFLHYDMNHLPGYYALGALVLSVTGDAVIAARLVSLTGGLIALGLAVQLAVRLGGRRAGWVAGALLVFQPEFALYASTSLREPVYTAFVMGSVTAIVGERLALAGALAGAAFLVRFDAAATMGPALLFAALGVAPRARRLLHALAPLALAVLLWSAYCRWEFGTFFFWSHTVEVNLETGLGQEAPDPLSWAMDGARVALALVFKVLPGHTGALVCLGAGLALVRAPWARHGLSRTLHLQALLFLGFWAGVGFTAQHEPGHNLYWKWMFPVVPLVVVTGTSALLALVDRSRAPRLAGALVGLGLLVGVGTGLVETRRQMLLSDVLYRPQLELARKIEAEIPESVPMVLDNIPACWINRRHHDRNLTSWFDVPTPPGDGPAFATWVREQHVGWVLWFREEWTQAPVIAPFLSEGQPWEEGGLRLEPVAREDEYGWIFYRVMSADGAPLDAPPAPQ